MRTNGAMLGHAVLRSFLGEVGDKTFFLSIVLTAWCPWGGIRRDEEHLFQTLLVFAGGLVALVLRVVFESVGWSTFPFRDSVFEASSFIVLMILGMKAKLELDRADAHEQGSKRLPKAEGDGGNPFNVKAEDMEKTPADDDAKWNVGAFSAIAPGVAVAEQEQQAQGYGAIPLATSADGVFSERISDKLVSHILAFLVPLVLGFAVEAEDKSDVALMAPHMTTATAFGACLGFLPAVLVAVGIGYIANRQLSDPRLLFLIVMGLTSLSLVSLSQALMHLGAASLEPQATTRQVLLSIFHSVRRLGQ